MKLRLSTRTPLALAVALLAFLAAACDDVEEEAPATGRAADIRYATVYGLEGVPATVTLTDGQWNGDPPVDSSSSSPAAYLAEHATGDIDNDGTTETAAIVITDGGGSGSFFHLVLFRQTENGLEHVATRLLGDRLQIRSLVVAGEGIRLASLEHGNRDAMCCPTLEVDRLFTTGADGMRLVSQQESGSPERAWGYLTWGHEMRRFETCDGRREGWAIDAVDGLSIGKLVQDLATAPYAPVFVDLEGRWTETPGAEFAAGFAQAFAISHVYRIEREGFGCRLDVDGLVFRAFGNEPGWRLDIRADGATLASMTMAETIRFNGDGRRDEQRFEFANDEFEMQVDSRKTPCRDTMSGSFFSHTVTIRLGDRTLEGCGIPGR